MSPAIEPDPFPDVQQLLSRPAEQRLREYKYRCAQALVFGLPVVGLEWFGRYLGGPEAPRYVAVLQALLAGWVMYVGAAGMLFEGLVLLRQRVSADLVVAIAAMLAYAASVVGAIVLLAGPPRAPFPLLFSLSVLLVAVWCGMRWISCQRRLPQARALTTVVPPAQPGPQRGE